MLGSDAAPVAFRSDSLELLERGVTTTLRLRPARAGVAITPTEATVTVTDPKGDVIVDAAPATCAAGVASYTVLGTVTEGLTLGEGWQVTWSVLLPGETVARTVRLEAALVRVRLYPVVTDQDLYRRVSGLSPTAQAPLSRNVTDFSPYLDDAWSTLQERLIARGNRPWLVMSPQALREAHITLTLARIFEDFATRLNAGYGELATAYRAAYQAAWTDMRFVYDRADGGTTASAGSDRKGTGASTWLGGRMR